MAGPTAGPWQVLKRPDGTAQYIGPDNTQWVARIAEDNIDEETRMVNAHIMAASKEMLQALEIVRTVVIGVWA